MHAETIIVTDRTMHLSNPVPVGSKIAITDISYSLDKRFDFYNLTIRAYPAEVKMQSQVFSFKLPITGYTFDSFKTKLLEDCKLIRPRARRFIAYRSVKRITMISNKLFFKKDRNKHVWLKLPPTLKFVFFKLEMSEALARALGAPAKNITVTHRGRVTLSHFLQGCNPQTPFTFIQFRPKKTVSIKCQEVDLKNHLDNVLHSFNIKLYTGFQRYAQKRHLFFAKLKPTVQHTLTFWWNSILKVHHITVLILRP